MPSERVVEIPWALANLPQSGCILDIGSCEATYLEEVHHSDRILHCLDARDCRADIPSWITFYNQSILGNTLPCNFYDGVLILSVIEHIGLRHYGMTDFRLGDQLTVAEIARVLKPGCPLIMTVPAGMSKIGSWYRQYSPSDLRALFWGWDAEYYHWGFKNGKYVSISEEDVEQYDYRGFGYGAGAITGIMAFTQRKDN